MSDDSKSFEKKLDRDFLQYLNLTKGLYENVKRPEDRQLCEVWLTHLFGKTMFSIAEKCDRNIYLSRLLIQMQNGKLTGVFLDSPPSGPLPCAFTAFGLPTEIDGLKGFEEMGFQVDSSMGGGSGDFFESSRDGRTYLATRHLPQGIMAYLAVTNNEGEPVWVPQTCPDLSKDEEMDNRLDVCEKQTEGYTKKLLDYIDAPLCQMRKTPEEREVVFEWMDKMINDCNKWIQGEDPHNMELEQLFSMLYEDYKNDPENAEILKHPRTVRTILYRDIRDRIAERRAQVAKRELILDQYESEQYTEELDEDDYIDDVWLECAKKPLANATKIMLDNTYPQEVIDRFTELLFQERLIIIRKGEREVKKKIADLRKASVDDTKIELQILKKAQNEYKEYYCAYKDVEEKLKEFEEHNREGGKYDQTDQSNMEKIKQELELEIQQAKRVFDREMRIQRDLEEKLEVAKDGLRRAKERASLEAERLNCQANQLHAQMDDLQEQICSLKKKNTELKCQLRR